MGGHATKARRVNAALVDEVEVATEAHPAQQKNRCKAGSFGRGLEPDQSPGARKSSMRSLSWTFRRAMIDECIWLTRDSERSRVTPISFMLSCS